MNNQQSSHYVNRFIAGYFLAEEKKGIRWAASVRAVASLIILAFFLVLNFLDVGESSAESEYLTRTIIIGATLFVMLSVVQYFIAGRRFYLSYLKYIFASIDVVIILYITIQAPIDIFYPFPTPVLLKSGISVLFFVLLATAALTFSPSLVLWTGASILVGWSIVLSIILGFKENIIYRDPSGFNLNFVQEVTLASDPYYIDLDRWGWEMVVIAIVTLILTLIVERSRRQILSQAKASFEKGVAEQSAEARAEFLATMSHEVRTPLNGLIGMTNLLSETPLNDQQKDYVQTMRFSGEALLGIVNDVLDLSKIEAGKLDFHPEKFNFVELVQNGLILFEQQLREKDLDHFIDIESDVPRYLVGDSFRLRQILLNLMSNAIKYTEHGMVGIQVRILAQSGSNIWLDFTVSDTGIGIGLEDQQKLFQRYGQADTTIERRYGGTGLGLYISKKIIDAMGGRIRVDSKRGEGSRFTVSLPFIVPADQEKVEPDTPQLVSPLRILIADDNAINRKILQNHLKTQGHQVKAVTNGREVLKALEKETFDILLLDLDMPVMDGYETVKKMHRRSEESFHLPVLAVTAGISEAKRQECLDLGIQEIILKPIAFAFLDKVLKKYGPL